MRPRSSEPKQNHNPAAPNGERPPTREADGRNPKDRDGLEQHRRAVEGGALPDHKSSDGAPAARPSTPDEELPLLGYENRGAVGFPNPDESLEQQVLVALEAEPSLDYSGLAVSVSDGIVTLGGSVKTARERDLAAKVAAECAGIEDVKNQLRVKS
jgi:hypothetical protein